MSDQYLVEPDRQFINELVGLGGDSLKKCFQCATCSVVCPISPEKSPFPRKEMIAASWGLKDRLVSNGDIWLCHNCGDCSTMCPRSAKPGDVLAAVRAKAIEEYATPKVIAMAVNDQKKLPMVLGVPAIIFAVLAMITMFGGNLMASLFGAENWYHTHDGLPAEGIAAAKFVSTWFVDMVFVPLTIWVVAVLGIGLNRFIRDMHKNALAEGKTDKKEIELKGFLQALIRVIPTIFKHEKFTACGENQDRASAHMMVLYAFIGLFVVTNIFFVVLCIFHIPGPYSQLNPVKWLANVSGVALVIGSALMIKSRLDKKDQNSTFKDWALICLVLALGVTGLMTEMARLADSAFISYLMYYLHLISIFTLFIYLPYSKLAHIVYRTVAMAYAEYGNRK